MNKIPLFLIFGFFLLIFGCVENQDKTNQINKSVEHSNISNNNSDLNTSVNSTIEKNQGKKNKTEIPLEIYDIDKIYEKCKDQECYERHFEYYGPEVCTEQYKKIEEEGLLLKEKYAQKDLNLIDFIYNCYAYFCSEDKPKYCYDSYDFISKAILNKTINNSIKSKYLEQNYKMMKNNNLIEQEECPNLDSVKQYCENNFDLDFCKDLMQDVKVCAYHGKYSDVQKSCYLIEEFENEKCSEIYWQQLQTLNTNDARYICDTIDKKTDRSTVEKIGQCTKLVYIGAYDRHENVNCNLVGTVWFKDGCRWARALKRNDKKSCDYIQNPEIKELCLQDFEEEGGN